MTALTLPDIASQHSSRAMPLDWVGMCNIAAPICLDGQRVRASVDAGVNLADGNARGIHMSRLYLALDQLEREVLTVALLRRVLEHFLGSHEGLSTRAYLSLRFDLMLKRPALISPLAGWKAYPVALEARLENGMFHVELSVSVDYSSTCPCSAALARQLIQQQFLEDFANEGLSHETVLAWLGSAHGIIATPHSQRSEAKVQVRLKEGRELPLQYVIDQVESVLGTAVQTAVKRADEQAFALANGQNLMFCEDAARRLHATLERMTGLAAFRLKVVHAESLHAHDAVASSQSCW